MSGSERVTRDARIAELETALIAGMVEDGADPADAEEEVRESIAPGVWASVRDV